MLNQYVFRVDGYEEDEKNVYYKLKITDLSILETKEIKVRYSTLSNIHEQLKYDNPYSDLPSFPQKNTFSNMINMFKNRENLEQLKQREMALNAYFQHLQKSYQIRSDAMLKFLKDGQDAMRQSSVRSLNDRFSSRQDFFKSYNKITIVSKDQFKKVYLVQQNGQKYYFNRFTLPNIETINKYIQIYEDAHTKITDFTHIRKAHYIFRIKQTQGFMGGFFGRPKSKKEKDNIYYKIGIQSDESKPLEFLYSLEEDCGRSLHEELESRIKRQEYFQFDDILSIIQSMAQGFHYLQKNNISCKQINLKNIYLQSSGVVKISAIQEPIQDFREKLIINSQSSNFEDSIFISPETLNFKYSSNGFLSSPNTNRTDSWAIGVCMLKLCTLRNKSDSFMDIHSSQSQCLKNLLQIVEDNYGGSLSSILGLMLARDPRDRADILDVIQQVYSTHLIPMRLDLLKQDDKPIKILKYQMSDLKDDAIKKFNTYIKENEKHPFTNYNFTFIQNEGLTEQQVMILLDQLRIITLRSLYLVFNKISYEDQQCENLILNTNVPLISLNLRDADVSSDKFLEIIKQVLFCNCKNFILDISGTNQEQLNQETINHALEILRSKRDLRFKIYWLNRDITEEEIIIDI